VYLPCLRAFRLPAGAPLPGAPPCIRHRFLPLTAGDRHGWSRSAARIVRHGRYVVLQLAEVAVPRSLFTEILCRIDRLRGPPMVAV
jgi:hypothetical protein